MKTANRFFLLLLLLAAIMGHCQSSYSVEAGARSLIDRQVGDIRKAADEVTRALDLATTAQVGEFQKWQDLAGAVNRYEQTFAGTIPLIDAQVKNLIDANPAAYVPHIEVSNPFSSYVTGATEKIAVIKRAIAEQDRRIAELDQEIGKFREAIAKGSREYLGMALEGFLPSQEQLLGEGGLVVFGAYFGPPGIIATSIAAGVAATFNGFVNLYYNTQALADQTKAFTDMIKLIEQHRDDIRAARAKNQTALSEMKQVLQALEMHSRTYDQLRSQLDTTVNAWTGYVDSSRRNQADKADLKLEEFQSREQKPYKPGPYWPVTTTPPPIPPEEWMGPARIEVARLADAVDSVMDGGNPRYVAETLQAIREAQFQRGEKIAARLKQARERWNAGFSQYLRGRGAAERAYWQAWGRARTEDERRAARSAYERALQALLPPMIPLAQECMAAHREQFIFSRTNSEIGRAWDVLDRKIEDYARATASHFNTAVSKHYQDWQDQQAVFALHSSAAYRALYSLRGYSERAERLDDEVADSLLWGGSVRQIVAALEANAVAVRRHGTVLRRELPAARRELTTLFSLGTQTQGAIESLLARDGLLIAMGGYWPYLSYYVSLSLSPAEEQIPSSFNNLAERREQTFEWVMKRFEMEEPEWLKDTGNIDADGIARKFDEKAAELQHIADAQAVFRARLTVAQAKIAPIAARLAPDGPSQGPGAHSARQELAEDRWMRFAKVADAFPAAARERLHAHDFNTWEQKNPRQRLLHVLVWLHRKAQEDFKVYLIHRRSGGAAFAMIPGDKYKEVKDLWQLLGPALAAFDAQAGAEQPHYLAAIEQITTAWAPVPGAYAAIPGAGQRNVAASYASAANRFNWLHGYLRTMAEALQPVGQSQAANDLQTWIDSYPAELKAYQERQEAARKLFEQQQREAEERRRAEEEAKRLLLAQHQAQVAAIEDFYKRFAEHYRRRNAAALVAMLDDNWSAGDGTTLADIEETFSNSFRVFDEVGCDIGGLEITVGANGTAKASYSITITGRIFRNRIKHEENSRVTEELRIDDGNPRILRTLSGRFWATH